MAQAACLGYLAYVLLTAHVLPSGTDTGSLPVRLLIIASLLVVVGLAASAVLGSSATRRAVAASDNVTRDVVLNVDPSRCVRYGFCAHEAPELFRLHSDGRRNYRAAVPPERVDDALRAAEACPHARSCSAPPDGWAYARFYNSEAQRRAALPGWLHFYNHHRAHSAINGQPPITRLNNLPGHHT